MWNGHSCPLPLTLFLILLLDSLPTSIPTTMPPPTKDSYQGTASAVPEGAMS
jgi:hypothetical protein